MVTRRNIDALVCDLLSGCPIEGSELVSSVHVGDAAHHTHHAAERIVKLVDGISAQSPWISNELSPARGARVLFVFHDGYLSCGEIHTRDGAFSRAVLSGPGEERIGERLREWQLRGVPHVLAGDSSLILTRVPLRDSSFHVVTVLWLGSQGYRVIDAPSVLLGVWQETINRNDSDEARYKMMEKASRASLPELADLLQRVPVRTVPQKTSSRSTAPKKKKSSRVIH